MQAANSALSRGPSPPWVPPRAHQGHCAGGGSLGASLPSVTEGVSVPPPIVTTKMASGMSSVLLQKSVLSL